MRLEEYIEEFGTSVPKIAKRAGLNAITVRSIVNQERDPALSTAISLEVATKGQVTCREMLPKTMLKHILAPPSQKKAPGDSKKSPKATFTFPRYPALSPPDTLQSEPSMKAFGVMRMATQDEVLSREPLKKKKEQKKNNDKKKL